jgi:ABC-2 type transport system ATP-binding protein
MHEPMGAALQVSEVAYSYGSTKAVESVSFEVRPGEVFGLLGPNGAGKTTTIAMISGLLHPAAGRILVFGHEPSDPSGRSRRRMGVVPQEVSLYGQLTGRENLEFWGAPSRWSAWRIAPPIALTSSRAASSAG